jgi:hypothetical protein
MATTTRNRSKSANVSQTAIDQVGSFLQDLSAKPREELSLREAIEQLADPIRGAMAKGYSQEDIVGILGENGIKTTVATLKRYIMLSGSQKKSRTKPAKRAAKAPVVKAPAPAKPAAKTTTRKKSAPVAAVAPAPARGRRKSAAAKVEAPQTTVKATKAKAPATRGRKKSS